MSNEIKQSASYIVSNEILSQEGNFTFEDILKKLNDKIDKLFESIQKMEAFVKEKINALCEIGLVCKTEIYYYVN